MHYACIIGVNHEWPEQRKELGDIGLARCLRGPHCQLPRERLVELYDKRATRSRVLYSLEQLLNSRNQNVTDDDVLLLYYGGHGKREEACTFRESIVDGKVQKEPWLRYDEIIDLLETHFHGGTVWVILDCCHSGGFGEAVMQRYYDCNNSLNVNYGCIMSVTPSGVAGMEWTMSECFIRAFKGELRCTYGDSAPYYLSTKKGKHSIKVPDEVTMQQNNDIDVKQKCHSSIRRPNWEQVIEFLTDEMARIKGDRLTTLFCGEKMHSSLKRTCVFGEPSVSTDDIDTETNPLSYISRDESWMDPFVIRSLSINDEVYVKLRGPTTSKYSVIGWLPARIVSINEGKDRIKIHIYDVITETSWVDEMATYDDMFDKTAICGLPFGFNADPQKCVTAVVHFAKQFCYLDTSVHPFTRIQVLWTDGEFYTGRVMSHTEISWEQMKQHEFDDDYNVIGPYLAVQWEEEDTTSLVPMGKCVVVDGQSLANKDIVVAQKSAEEAISTNMKSIETPYDAAMTSFAASGKQLHSPNSPISSDIELTEQNMTEWEAYDAEDKEYLPVKIMNDLISMPLEVLSYHTLYPQSGDFSVVFWEDDSVLSLLPSTFLRPRSCGDDSSAESSDSSTIDDECSELHPSGNISKTQYIPKWTMILQLGLLSTSFYAGYLFGKRQKVY